MSPPPPFFALFSTTCGALGFSGQIIPNTLLWVGFKQ